MVSNRPVLKIAVFLLFLSFSVFEIAESADSKKSSITFDAIINNKEENDSSISEGSSMISQIMAILLVLSLTIFAFIDYQTFFKSNSFFGVEDRNEIILISLIEALNTSETIKMINHISIDKEIKILLTIDNLDKINSIKSILDDSYSFKIYEVESYGYDLEISNKLVKVRKRESQKENITNSIREEFNTQNFEKSIILKTDIYTIFKTLQEIIDFSLIEIFPDKNSDLFNLEFSY